MVHNMSAAWGSDSACVAEQPKQWVFGGDGTTPDGATDLIKFVIDHGDCDTGSDVALIGSDMEDAAMYLKQGNNATFSIDLPAAGNLIYLCYKFGNENFQWYNITTYVHMLQSLGSWTGGTDIAVVEVQEIGIIRANGSSLQDKIRWVLVDGAPSDFSCGSGIVDLWDHYAKDTDPETEAPVYLAEGSFLANFTFNASSAGLSPTLCYKFAGECCVGVPATVGGSVRFNVVDCAVTIRQSLFCRVFSPSTHYWRSNSIIVILHKLCKNTS